MRKFVSLSAAMSAALLLGGNSAMAANPSTITLSGTNNTTAETLGSASGQGTFTLNAAGTLTVSGSSAALTLKAASNGDSMLVTNNGAISQTGTGNAITDGTGNENITINNGSLSNTTASLTTANADTINFNHATNNIILNNYGSITSNNSSAGGNQAIDWNKITDGATAGEGANTLNNYSTGTITSSNADAVRPGIDGFINNAGTIKSTATTDTSSDGIDLQQNSGVTIVNAAAGLGTGGANLIEGARHGITGGQDVDTADTSTYGLPFILSVTNNAGGKIFGDNGSGINIDGVNASEVVTVVNSGTISGNGVTADGDGVDVDGLVNITNNTGGVILSKNAFQDASEGITVGGGTIINSGTIEGSTSGTSTYARGITLAGVDNATTSGTKTAVPIKSIYGDTTVTNNSGGLIEGDTESGIAVLGTTSGAHTVTINNAGTIEGSNTGVSERGTGAASGASLNQAVIELDDTSNTYIVNESGTITQGTTSTGTAIAMHSTVSNTLNITGGAAVITGNISGDTAADSTLNINPGTGNSFSYGYNISGFKVNVNADGKNGTVTLSGANTYAGTTTVNAGTLNVANTTGSATGTGKVVVGGTAPTGGVATIGGTGIIKPGAGNGVTLGAGSTLVSGGTQSGTTAGAGLTLDNTVAQAVILDASIGSANLTFSLGANHSATTMDVLGNTLGEVKLAAGDTITLNDLTSHQLTFSIQTPYVLIQAGTTAGLLADNNLYAGITTTGGTDAQGNILNGYVTTPIGFNFNGGTQYAATGLYLNNGALEMVPEPGTWAMMLGGLGVLVFIGSRRRQKI